MGLHDVIEALIHKISWHSEAEKAEILAALDEDKPAAEPAPETPEPLDPTIPASTL